MNPLEDNPRARSIAYQVFWTVSLLIGAAHVGYGAVDGATTPTWLTVALSVLPFVGAGIGYTASQNTPAHVARHGGGLDHGAGYGSGVGHKK